MRKKRITLTDFLILQIEKDVTERINSIRLDHLRGWGLSPVGIDNKLQELGVDIINDLNHRLGLKDDANS